MMIFNFVLIVIIVFIFYKVILGWENNFNFYLKGCYDILGFFGIMGFGWIIWRGVWYKVIIGFFCFFFVDYFGILYVGIFGGIYIFV